MALQDFIEETFIQDRHGIRTTVVLKEIRSRKVVLQSPGRVDSFTMGIGEFEKKFTHTPTPEVVEDVR